MQLHFVEHATCSAGHFCLSNLEPHLVLCWNVVRAPAHSVFASVPWRSCSIHNPGCSCAFERVLLLVDIAPFPVVHVALVVPVLLRPPVAVRALTVPSFGFLAAAAPDFLAVLSCLAISPSCW